MLVKYPERYPSEGADWLWLPEGRRSSCCMWGLEGTCGGQWCLVALVEDMVPGALSVLGPCKLLFAQAATTGF